MGDVAIRRRLAAILAADVAGYSRLMGLDDIGTLNALRDARQIVDTHVVAAGGRVFNTAGDSIVAEFPSVVEAVRSAVAIQSTLNENSRDVPADRRLRFRIGVNLGDIIAEGDNVYGEGVNVAARLEALADPGGICVSGGVHDEIQNKLEVGFRSGGTKKVKNIQAPLRIYHWRADAGDDSALQPPRIETPERPSIAVLPFRDLTGDPESQYFSDGVTEDIIAELSRFRGLFVISHRSSFLYRDRADDWSTVGRELGVRYLLTGSVRRSGTRIRISTQLIETETSRHIWAVRYDRDLSDIFAVQDEVVRAIVGVLPGRLEIEDMARARRKRPDSLMAYDYHLRAWDLIYRLGGNEHDNVRQLLEKAIELEPNYAQAHALMSFCEILAWFRNAEVMTLDRALDLAERAIALDPEDSWCNFMIGYVCLYRREFERARNFYNRALALNANDADILSQMGSFMAYLGKPEEGIDYIRQAMRLNPYRSAWHWHDLGFTLIVARRYEEAVEAFGRVVPPLPFDDLYKSVCLIRLGRKPEAKTHMKRFLAMWPAATVRLTGEKEPFLDPETAEAFNQSLREAGMPA